MRCVDSLALRLAAAKPQVISFFLAAVAAENTATGLTTNDSKLRCLDKATFEV